MKPTPSPKFWNKVAKRYSERPIEDIAAYETKLEKTRKLFKPDMRVLEFGCGTGGTAILHAPNVRHITALDISESMIAIAKEKAEKTQVNNIEFVCSDIESYTSESEQYDVVLGLSILHLLPDHKATLKHIYKVLKPGGYFVSSTTCLSDGYKFVKWIEPIGLLFGFMPRVVAFTSEELTQDIQNAGFSIEESWRPGDKKAIFLISKKADRSNT